MKHINICWVIPQYTQLRIVPDVNSPLKKLIPNGEVMSYDIQSNYPHSTTAITNARQLQSALPDINIHASILNLAAVPRGQFIDGDWKWDYLSDKFQEIQYGRSKLELRRIGKDIDTINGLEDIVANNDLFIVPSSFETHVPEQKRIARYLKDKYGDKVTLLASGTGVEGYEEELLSAGFDIVFVGTVTDRGEEVLEAMVQNDITILNKLPGVHTNLGNERVRNIGARNYRRQSGSRLEEIREWRNRLPKYQQYVDIDFCMVGRPDLATSLKADQSVEYCCSMQDLPFHTISDIVKSGNNVVFAADEIFPMVGCPRECGFCHASGKGVGQNNLNYSLKLLDFYKQLGVTDIIPTDDQILLSASGSKKDAKQLVAIYEQAKELGFSFFYGNGVEVYALAKIIEKSQSPNPEQTIYQDLIRLFCDTASYVFLPYENISGLVNKKYQKLAKLSLGRSGFEIVLSSLNGYAEQQGRRFEVGTNIIFSETPTRGEIQEYYNIMDLISKSYNSLNMRYNGFFMIPSRCAPHISHYRTSFDLALPNEHPELKLVSIPTIKYPSEEENALEQRLAWNIEARNHSRSKRQFRGGIYEDA